MPRRATKRGDARTPIDADCDVLICGASFAGLAVARELRNLPHPPDVMIVDRYEIGERQTSACAVPTAWLHALKLTEALQQTFGQLVIHTPHATARYDLPWTFSTFDYRTLCELLADQGSFRFETAAVRSRVGDVVVTDRGKLRAPLIVDALGWRRVLGLGANVQPPDALLSRGLEVHPFGSGEQLEIWIDRRYVPAGYGWSFPAGDEVRIGIGSFDPRFHVKEPTDRLAREFPPTPGTAPQPTADDADVIYQGNWIPHALRPATEDGVFFVGDSAGHCLPLTAEGIRTALYFGIACGRELRRVIAGEQTRADALHNYHRFSAAHGWQFQSMLRVQRLIPRIPPRLLAPGLRGMQAKRFVDWSFGHYLNIAHPSFAGSPDAGARSGRTRVAALAA